MQVLPLVARVRAWPLILRISIAVGLTGLALLGRMHFLNELGSIRPYLTFYPAILLSAILGGAFAGAVAASLSAIGAVMFIPELFQNEGPEGILAFLTTALLLIAVVQLATKPEQERTEHKSGEHRDFQLRQLIKQAPVAIAMFDRDMVYLAASEQWLQVFGLERASIIGRCHYDIFPNLPKRYIDAHRRGLRGEQVSEEFDSFDDHGGSSKYFRWQVQPWQGVGGQTGGIIIISEDLTQRVTAERALKSSEHRLRLAVEAGNMAIWDWDIASGHIVWNDQHFCLLGYEPGSIEPSYEAWARRVVPEDLDKIEPEIQKVLKLGNRYSAQFRVRGHDDKVRWIEAFGQVTHTPDGRPERMYGIMWDITEAKTAADHRELLLAEVNHRAKNLLAVVQSIANVTAYEGDPKTFAATFNSRIKALAACHGLLVRSEWHGADLEDLIRSQVSYLDKSQDPRIEIEGPKLQINALAAQIMAMAIHELSTNSIKYGALSSPQGRVGLRWEIDPMAARFQLHWTETGGPTTKVPEHLGFGSAVMKDDVEHALDAQVSLSFPSSGLVYSISASLTSVAEDGRDSEVSDAAAHR